MAEQTASSITMKEVQDLMIKDKKEDDPAIVVPEEDTPKIDNNQTLEAHKDAKILKQDEVKQEIPVKQKNGLQE